MTTQTKPQSPEILNFDAVYERLSRSGHCDSPDGMEYKRVLCEWAVAGCPADIDEFIIRRANIGPSDE